MNRIKKILTALLLLLCVAARSQQIQTIGTARNMVLARDLLGADSATVAGRFDFIDTANANRGGLDTIQGSIIRVANEYYQRDTTNKVWIRQYFNSAFPFTNNSCFYGTSITLGNVGAVIPYPNVVQGVLGNTTITNLAVGSTATRTACKRLAAVAPLNMSGATIGDAAFNNSRWAFSNTAFDTTRVFQQVNAGARWIAALQFTDTLQFYRIAAGTVNSNFSTSQAAVSALPADTLADFGSRAVKFGTNIWFKQSITANETITIANVRGSDLIVGVWADSSGGSRITYAVDGITIGTYNPNNRCVLFNFDIPSGFIRPAFQNDVIHISGLQDTLHSVVLTFLDAGAYGGVDFVGNLKTPSRAAFNPCYVLDIEHMNATGYAVTGGSAAVQDSCTNSRWAALLAAFPAYVQAFAKVHVNIGQGGSYDPNDPAQIQSDGIHVSGLGHRHIANDIIKTINAKAKPENSFSLAIGNAIISGTPKSILYIDGASTLAQDSSKLAWDYTNKRLGVGTSVPVTILHTKENTTGFSEVRVENINTGGQVGFQAVNDIPYIISMRMKGSTAGAYSAYTANTGAIYSNAIGGMTFFLDANAPITFLNGSGGPPPERMRILGSNGNVGIANASPSEKLDVTGNVRFSGALMPNNLPGTAGQGLRSAGAGVAPTWGLGIDDVLAQAQSLTASRDITIGVNILTFSGTTGQFNVAHSSGGLSANLTTNRAIIQMDAASAGVSATFNVSAGLAQSSVTDATKTSTHKVYPDSIINNSTDGIYKFYNLPAGIGTKGLRWDAANKQLLVADAPGVVAFGDYTAISATQVLTTYTTPNDGTVSIYNIAAKLSVTAVSAGVLTTTVVYTDETNASRTVTFFGMGLTSAGLTTTGVSNFPVMGEIACLGNTAITVTTTLTIGTATYNAHATITYIRNYTAP